MNPAGVLILMNVGVHLFSCAPRVDVEYTSEHRMAAILRVGRELGWPGIGVNVSVDTPWRCPL